MCVFAFSACMLQCGMTVTELKIIFFARWPCGQPFHDLVGHLIKSGGQNELLCL